jgi:hypothetical protein
MTPAAAKAYRAWLRAANAPSPRKTNVTDDNARQERIVRLKLKFERAIALPFTGVQS